MCIHASRGHKTERIHRRIEGEFHFTIYSRAKDNIWIERFWKTALICSLESRDLLTTITATVVTKESTVQYQAGSTSVRQFGLNYAALVKVDTEG